MGGWVVVEKKTKLMLYSTQVEVKVEVEVELGNISGFSQAYLRLISGIFSH